MTSFFEIQCDGLIGPTHNYAGLSFGNVASQAHEAATSHPKTAALQGLEKMRAVHALGLKQVILPPPLRPNLALMQQCGIDAVDAEVEDGTIAGLARRAAWSASTMWSANAATVSPAPDTGDGKTHITIANLASSLHRSQEAPERLDLLRRIFSSVATVHEALPACTPLTDEGAANHMRLSPSHGAPGIEIFVYGKAEAGPTPQRYPARQTRAACELITHLHHLPSDRAVLAQQHPDAIDAGVFHNDVIAMSNADLLILHEYTFMEEADVLAEINDKADFPVTICRISNDELPLADAVSSYFFNSQLLSLPDGSMTIIAPVESKENPAAHAALTRICESTDNPVRSVHYLDVRESMCNGGGPACLRLRVVLDEASWQTLPDAYKFTPARYETIGAFIRQHYPDTLTINDLRDAQMAEKMHAIHHEMQLLFDAQ